MIGTRTATALSLLLSLVAVALGITALALALREQASDPAADLIQTRTASVPGDPIMFPLHDFYLSGDADGRPIALYLYPPGFYGSVRGCKVLWVRDDMVAVDGAVAGPGLFVDPCGGARFDREGRLVAGEADRGLDRFRTFTEIGGEVVDLSVLYCGPTGPAGVPVIPAMPTLTPAPSVAPPPPRLGLTTVTPTATGTATATWTATRTPTPRSLLDAEECERVRAPR